MFKEILIVSILCSFYGNCVGCDLKFNVYKDHLCSTFVNAMDVVENRDDIKQNLKEKMICVVTEEFPLINGSLQAFLDVKVSQVVEISLIVFKTEDEDKDGGIEIVEIETFTSLVSQETVIHRQISVKDPATNDRGYAILLGNPADTSSFAVNLFSFIPTSFKASKTIITIEPKTSVDFTNSNDQINNNIATVQSSSKSGLPSTDDTYPSISNNQNITTNVTSEIYTALLTASLPAGDLQTPENTTPIVTVPFPTVSRLPTTESTIPIVTVPFPTVSGLPTTQSTTPIVTVPFPTVSGLPTTESTIPIVTVPFPTVSGLPNTQSTTPIVTVPFPTVSGLPTTQSTTPIVTVPFPTVSGLPTTESTTPIVTVPFPTVSGLPTTKSTTPVVTVPFPTVSEVVRPTTTPEPTQFTVAFPTVSDIDISTITNIESTTPEFTTEETIWDGVTAPSTDTDVSITADPTPIESEDFGGLDPFLIAIISVSCVTVVVIVGFAGWYFFTTGTTSKYGTIV